MSHRVFTEDFLPSLRFRTNAAPLAIVLQLPTHQQAKATSVRVAVPARLRLLKALLATRNIPGIRRLQSATSTRRGPHIPHSLRLNDLGEAFRAEAVGVQTPAGLACICFTRLVDYVAPGKQSCRIDQQVTIVAKRDEQLFDGDLQEAAKPIELIAERLSEVVDAEFKELCRLERIENGALHFGVADTSAPAKMYRRWGEKILRALPTGLKIKRIVFAFGTRGRRID